MATGSITTYSSISEIIATLVGEAQVGGNGSGDPPEFDITDVNGNGVDGSVCWDDDLSDGFDSDWVPAVLDVEPSGDGITWTITVDGPQALTYSGITYGTIVAVGFRAAVQTSASSAWRQVSVQFYQSGSLTDSYSLRAGPQINLHGSSLPAAGEQILTITPNANTNDKVIVSGQFRFTNASTSPPDPEDMFAQIFVQTT
jgi:hypothetical protein